MNLKKAKPGDRVTARVTRSLICGGKKLVPSGSKLIGHVTEAVLGDGQQPESRLGVVFDSVEVKRGGRLLFTGTLQAIAVRMTGFGGQDDSVACQENHLNCNDPPPLTRPRVEPGTRGVIGFEGFTLDSDNSVISSTSGNIRLGWYDTIVVKIAAVPL